MPFKREEYALLVDGHNDILLLEDIHLRCPLANAIVRALDASSNVNTDAGLVETRHALPLADELLVEE